MFTTVLGAISLENIVLGQAWLQVCFSNTCLIYQTQKNHFVGLKDWTYLGAFFIYQEISMYILKCLTYMYFYHEDYGT